MELGTDNFILRTMGERYLWNREGKQKSNLSQTLFLPSPSGNAQMLSIVIQTKTGGLVVDGGWKPDGERLCSLLKEHGGHVTAWLLTHPHSDHVGVLYGILKNRVGELQIDRIYYSFGDPQWYETASPKDPGMARQLLEVFKCCLWAWRTVISEKGM